MNALSVLLASSSALSWFVIIAMFAIIFCGHSE